VVRGARQLSGEAQPGRSGGGCGEVRAAARLLRPGRDPGGYVFKADGLEDGFRGHPLA
jgi:hypothetical protein